MTRNNNLKRLSMITGAALAMSVSAAASASSAAEVNPFGMTELSQGFQLAGNEGKCGGSKSKSEAKCGEGKCGDGKSKSSEGKCGEGKCGGSKSKSEAKCGEGKCGGSK